MSDDGRDALRGYSKKIRLGIFRSWVHIDISAYGKAPCWVYSNENVSGQFQNNQVISPLSVAKRVAMNSTLTSE